MHCLINRYSFYNRYFFDDWYFMKYWHTLYMMMMDCMDGGGNVYLDAETNKTKNIFIIAGR